MTYVPILTPTPTQEASPRARDLALRIADLVREFELQHPGTSRQDVRQALQIARTATGPLGGSGATAAIAVGLGLLVLLGGLVFFFAQSGGELPWPPLALLVGGLLVVLLAVAVIRNKG